MVYKILVPFLWHIYLFFIFEQVVYVLDQVVATNVPLCRDMWHHIIGIMTHLDLFELFKSVFNPWDKGTGIIDWVNIKETEI